MSCVLTFWVAGSRVKPFIPEIQVFCGYQADRVYVLLPGFVLFAYLSFTRVGVGGDAVIRRRTTPGYSSREDSSADTTLVKPKLELNNPLNREDEEEKLKSILR